MCKRYDVDWPINFLSKYTWSLENFMDSLVDVIKWRKEFCEAIYERVWVSNEMLKNMTNKSFIEMIKKDIEKIPTYNYDESVKTASYYVRAVRLVCIRLWMD